MLEFVIALTGEHIHLRTCAVFPGKPKLLVKLNLLGNVSLTI